VDKETFDERIVGFNNRIQELIKFNKVERPKDKSIYKKLIARFKKKRQA